MSTLGWTWLDTTSTAPEKGNANVAQPLRAAVKPPQGDKDAFVFGDHEDRVDPARLATVKVTVAGLKKGSKVRVLFEYPELVSEEGCFVDDFRGTNLYQRYGGEGTGDGDNLVAVHVYAVPR
ncbi:MAG TPA: hypothetical protein VHR66_27215 [Gemmataceae bacterium]|nr:hypothetical protein [Gemmataceae bacterium]